MTTFDRLARSAIRTTGHPLAFIGACLAIVLWLLAGPAAHFSDTWQLVINTATTIVTFLMVFLIQAGQNIESKAIHVKLNELIAAAGRAKNERLDAELLSGAQLDQIIAHYQALARHNREEK